jgi:hypothetical protein
MAGRTPPRRDLLASGGSDNSFQIMHHPQRASRELVPAPIANAQVPASEIPGLCAPRWTRRKLFLTWV